MWRKKKTRGKKKKTGLVRPASLASSWDAVTSQRGVDWR